MFVPRAANRLDCVLQLAGLSLFLATIEMSIPKPMPFLKLGIANLPILLYIRQLQFRELLLLVFFKTLCHSLITGSLLSYIAVFSACSSLASGSAMWLLALAPPKYFSLLGISVVGAAASNGAQLWLALHYFFPGTASLLIPWGLSFGLGSGVLLGWFALQFAHGSQWYHATRLFLLSSADSGRAPQAATTPELPQGLPIDNKALRCFAFGLLSLGLMIATGKYEPIYLFFGLCLFICLNKRLGYRPWWRSMVALLAVLVFFHLLLPSGRMLWQIQLPPYLHFRLTQGALERGLGKAFLLLNLIQISRLAVSPHLRLPGRLGHIVQIVFSYYQGLLNSPIKFRAGRPFASLDAILRANNGAQQYMASQTAKHLSGTTLAIALLVQVGILLLGKFWPLYYLMEI